MGDFKGIKQNVEEPNLQSRSGCPAYKIELLTPDNFPNEIGKYELSDVPENSFLVQLSNQP